MGNKIKEFAKGNWVSLVEIGIFAAVEIVIVKAYKDYLKKSEEDLFG